MQPSPSAVYHYSDTGGHSSHVHHSKVNAVFQAAKKDLLKIIQLQARLRPACEIMQQIQSCLRLYTNKFIIPIIILFVFVLQDPSLLEGRITLRQVKAGSVVANQGDQVCSDIWPRSCDPL